MPSILNNLLNPEIQKHYKAGNSLGFDFTDLTDIILKMKEYPDDIDALLYEGGSTVNLISLEGTSIPDGYTVSSLVDLKQREMAHNAILFSSEIIYDVDVVILLSKNSVKVSNKIGKEFSKRSANKAKIALSDPNEELNITEVLCDIYVSKENEDIITK